eukprot:Pompholyxophrys_punicea_v1_NODE_489_length_1855_cov_3.903333.p2 type:complete len:102 gc:universal NODE_489_length_1855_cov_3.903333:854-549(-)
MEKRFTVLANSSSDAVCDLCRATPSQMNDYKLVVAKKANPAYLKHGISNLHAYIRCLEYVLNISIRLKINFCQWRVPKQQKPQFKEKELEIPKKNCKKKWA